MEQLQEDREAGQQLLFLEQNQWIPKGAGSRH
jgi:hypothetical protein